MSSDLERISFGLPPWLRQGIGGRNRAGLARLRGLDRRLAPVQAKLISLKRRELRHTVASP